MTSESWQRTLLKAEVIICFAPITVTLVYGLFVLPSLIIQAFSYGQNTWPYIVTVIGGAFGFFGVFSLLLKYLLGERSTTKRWTIVTCLFVGCVAFGYFAVVVLSAAPSFFDYVMFAAPALSGAHLLYVSRRYLI
jgi:hypothetical protein